MRTRVEGSTEWSATGSLSNLTPAGKSRGPPIAVPVSVWFMAIDLFQRVSQGPNRTLSATIFAWLPIAVHYGPPGDIADREQQRLSEELATIIYVIFVGDEWPWTEKKKPGTTVRSDRNPQESTALITTATWPTVVRGLHDRQIPVSKTTYLY